MERIAIWQKEGKVVEKEQNNELAICHKMAKNKRY